MERNAQRASAAEEGASSGGLSSRSLISELASYWLMVTEAERRVQPQTIDNYRWQVRDYIVPRIGRWRLSEVTVGKLDRVLVDMRVREGNLKAYRTRSILMAMFRLAATYDLIPVNYAAQTNPVRREPKEIVALSPSEVAQFREALRAWCHDASRSGPRRGRRLLLIFEVLIGTGMRIGELLALRPASVDFEHNRILIGATLVYSQELGLRIQEHPKRASQRRWLPMTATVRGALAEAIDASVPSTVPVFHSRDQRPLWPNNVRRSFHRFLRDSAIEPLLPGLEQGRFSPHTLRRTTATGLAQASSTEAARDLLGHSKIATTEQAYAKRTGVVDPAIAEVVERLFGVIELEE